MSLEIEAPGPLADHKQRTRTALELLLLQPSAHVVPPCQNCRKHVPVTCNAKCPDAPCALSSDPEHYPLESKVVPLVYELRKTRVMQPCWSCEGHMDGDGNLWKYPQVCFFSPSPVYATLLVNHLSALRHQRKLNNDWNIIITSFGNHYTSTTYTIEPKFHPADDQHLGALQADLINIAENLELQLKSAAIKMLETLS